MQLAGGTTKSLARSQKIPHMPVFLFLKTLRVFCAFDLLLVATVDVEHMELNRIYFSFCKKPDVLAVTENSSSQMLNFDVTSTLINTYTYFFFYLL